MKNADRRNRRRMLRIETLESRYMLSGNDWDHAALTLSFVPDGTSIGEHTSALYQKFGTVDAAVWQQAILRAFQTWSQHSNLNLGVVPDQGLPLGTSESPAGDNRFGEIRVGAVPMSPETLAVSVPQDDRVAGSWAGDVLFNSNGEFDSVDDIFKVALHEAGHVFGLEHSSDPLSPMYSHSANIQSQLTLSDIANLGAQHGPRMPDRHDRVLANDTLAQATIWGPSEGTDGYDGSTPAIEFGDITSATDVDHFRLRVLSDYTGPMTFQTRSLGLSLLMPKLTVLDSQGQSLGTAASALVGGDLLTVTLPSVTAGGTYFVRVEGASGDMFGRGAYAIVAAYNDRNQVTDERLTEVLRRGHRFVGFDNDVMGNDDLRRFFAETESHLVNDDLHTNDTQQTPSDIEPSVISDVHIRHQIVASLADSADVDFYKVSSGDFNNAYPQYLTVSLESLAAEGLIGQVIVRDRNGAAVPAQVRANGQGQFVLEVLNVPSDREYWLEVRSTADEPFYRTGNYKLSATFATTRDEPTMFADAELTATAPEQEAQLFVAKTQLFSFSLQSTPVAGPAVVWMTIYDPLGKPVYVVAGQAGAPRSSASVLLGPGEYRVQIGVKHWGGDLPAPVQVTVAGRQLSDPIGPPLTDPTETPLYACENLPALYCYTLDDISDYPYFWDPLPDTSLPSVNDYLFDSPSDLWYWHTDLQKTNPLSLAM